MSRRSWPIGVRVAQPDDRSAVLAFATHTWEGWDYIPQVWDSWVVPSSGVALVATALAALNGEPPRDAEGNILSVGQPVALTRVVMLSPTEAWVEGIRVDPRVRGMNVATDLQVAELHWIAAHGGTVVRYMTSVENVGSQRLGARHGLLEIGRWRTYETADHDHDETGNHRLPTDDELSPLRKASAASWAQVQADAVLQAGLGLYEYRSWAFQLLSEERYHQHVARGEVLTAWDGTAWAALIVNGESLAEGELHVALALGDGPVLINLLGAIHKPAIRLPDAGGPALAELRAQLAAAGYAPFDFSAIVVERPFDAVHPLPPADDPATLVFLDEPRPIVVPPSLDGGSTTN